MKNLKSLPCKSGYEFDIDKHMKVLDKGKISERFKKIIEFSGDDVIEFEIICVDTGDGIIAIYKTSDEELKYINLDDMINLERDIRDKKLNDLGI